MRFGLLGNNISYSYSKMIHEFVFNYYNYDYSYDILDICEDKLDEFFLEFKNGSYKGINVTIPYKEKVMKYLDKIDDSALKLGNVNTIVNIDNTLIGYNTDFYGFHSLLKHYNIVPNISDNIYILGTGGAAKTVYNVFKQYTNNINFVSRNKLEYNIISYNDLNNLKIDYLVNATPCGDKNHLEDMLVNIDIINKSKIVIDLIYNPKITKLLSLSKTGYNGLVMLIYQALEADKLFLNKNIDENYLVKKVGELFE